MNKGGECFQALCDAPDATEAVRSLSGPHLQELIGYCGREMDENNIHGEVMGVCLEEAVKRLAKDQSK